MIRGPVVKIAAVLELSEPGQKDLKSVYAIQIPKLATDRSAEEVMQARPELEWSVARSWEIVPRPS